MAKPDLSFERRILRDHGGKLPMDDLLYLLGEASEHISFLLGKVCGNGGCDGECGLSEQFCARGMRAADRLDSARRLLIGERYGKT